MRHDKRKTATLRRIEPLPLPPSLEAAFEAVENLDAMHPSSRGQTFAGIIHPASREQLATMTQGGRLTCKELTGNTVL